LKGVFKKNTVPLQKFSMTKNKQKIIDYAKSLYTQYNSEGKKLYSLRDIEQKITQKFHKTFTYRTVKNWAEKYDWNKLNEKIKQQSIEKAEEKKFTKEEQLIEKESDKLAKDYKNAETLANIGYKIVIEAYDGKEHSLISVRDAMTAIKIGTDIKFRIMEIPEKSEDLKGIILSKKQIKNINDALDDAI